MKNLIIGQGLAGTVLAFRLLQRGENVTVIDNSHKQASSLVAAGMWNPIAFKRMNKSWRADDFIPELNAFYPEVEQIVDAQFFFEKKLFRMHGSKQEADFWMEKQTLPGFKDYLKTESPAIEAEFNAPEHGSGEVMNAGFVHMPMFLNASSKYFEKEGILKKERFHLPSTQAEIDDLGFDRVIDCRGVVSSLDSNWEFLPFSRTKGEVLTVRAPKFKLSGVFNAGFFILPIGDDLFRIGATFDRQTLDYEPTETGKETLLAKVRKWTDLPFEIIEHKAGIRPTVRDRRPLIGRHPSISSLFIFNGLGAKGVMMAPYLSKRFVANILDAEPLPEEVNISRFNA